MHSIRNRVLGTAFFAAVCGFTSLAMAAEGPDTASIRSALALKPVAFWDFNDEGGDTLHDRTGNQHHGIVHGAKWMAGVEGGGLEFGGNDWVEVPGDSGMHLISFTLSMWMWQSGNGLQAPLMEFQWPSAQAGVHLWANTNGWGNDVPGAFYANLRSYDPAYPQLTSSSNDNLINSAGGSSQGGRWNHVVLTFDKSKSTARLYVNGKLLGSRTYPAFYASTVGSLLIGTRDLASHDNLGGLGFQGILDDGAIFDFALSESQVISLYGRSAPEPRECHFGFKTHYAKSSDTLWVPLYLSSLGKDSLSSLQFDLNLDSTVVELLDVRPDTAMTDGWSLADWNRVEKSRIPLAMAGTRRITGPEEGEILRLKIRVLSGAKVGASSMLTLTRISVDEGRVTAVSHMPGKIFVLPHASALGDVNGNGEVDSEDARILLEYVIGKFTLPSVDYPFFITAAADVTGNGEITSYDAALVLQYGFGIIEEFPAERKVLAKRNASSATMALEGPIHLDGNRYRYRILAADMDGMAGGKVSLKMGGDVKSVLRAGTAITGARIGFTYDPQANLLQLGLMANRKLQAASSLFAEWDVEYADGSGPGPISYVGASLNEGEQGISGWDASGLRDEGGKPGVARKNPLQVSLSGRHSLGVSAPGEGIGSIAILSYQGRVLISRNFPQPVTEAQIGLEGVPGGLKLIRVKTKDGRVLSAIWGSAH